MAKKTKADLEKRLKELEEENCHLRELNAQQLNRITGDSLLRIRISELEIILNEVTDELIDVKLERDSLSKQLERVAMSRGMNG